MDEDCTPEVSGFPSGVDHCGRCSIRLTPVISVQSMGQLDKEGKKGVVYRLNRACRFSGFSRLGRLELIQATNQSGPTREWLRFAQGEAMCQYLWKHRVAARRLHTIRPHSGHCLWAERSRFPAVQPARHACVRRVQDWQDALRATARHRERLDNEPARGGAWWEWHRVGRLWHSDGRQQNHPAQSLALAHHFFPIRLNG